jgi:predicted transcriptional regulator
MTTLKVGIACYAEMKARTMAVARGERRIAPGEPKVWFTSTESFAKILSAGNRDLLRVIAEQAPASLDELSRITGKAKSNLSRTLKTMAATGWCGWNVASGDGSRPRSHMIGSNSTCRLFGRARRG